MKVLIAIDDSPCTDYMLNVLKKKKWNKDTQFKVVTVIEPILEADEDALRSMESINIERHNQAHHLCLNAQSKIEKSFPGCTVLEEIRQGSAVDEITFCAEEWGADTIILGAHRVDTCPHNLCGSVSRNIVRHAPCSVEVIKPKSADLVRSAR